MALNSILQCHWLTLIIQGHKLLMFTNMGVKIIVTIRHPL